MNEDEHLYKGDGAESGKRLVRGRGWENMGLMARRGNSKENGRKAWMGL